MRYRIIAATLLSAVSSVFGAGSNVVSDTSDLADSYDFVIVGGGLAGLVLGARLSEDEGHSVLVLEAGSTGDEYSDLIDVPANTYYKDLWDVPINWQFETVPQPNVNGTGIEWPRGKVLGGSSAINGLYLTRPAEIEINAWRDMLGDMDGAENWSWDSLFAAMKKSETFSPPADNIASQGAIAWNADSRGTSGPIHASYPGWMIDVEADWTTASGNAGVPASQDTYGGENWGSYVATSAINPANWTRSFSRSGYLDPLPPRSNYDVLPNAQVTRILFDSDSEPGNKTANAVEYSLYGSNPVTVNVSKEVVLAGGSVGSPTVLQYSGVGPKDVLSAAGVDLVSELPGVGEHLQDHLSVYTQWKSSDQTAGDIYHAGGSEASDTAFLSLVSDAVGYASAAQLFDDGGASLKSSVASSLDQYAPSDANVAAGYTAISKNILDTLWDSQLGQIELLMGINAENTLSLGASIQHPFSAGRIYITSNNPTDDPAIDPMYLTNPADAETLVAGLKLIRMIGEADPLNGVLEETWPGSDVQSDGEWDKWMRQNVFTNYHPASTCAMLPLDQGGVVDGNLRVYGLSNVRVADASVPPFVFSAHLMTSTYGIAERAAEIIRADWTKKDNLASALAVHSSSHHKSSTSTSDGDNGDEGDNESGSKSSSSGGDANAGATYAASPFAALLALGALVVLAF